MAINRGPNIVQDGLVFGYDADDRSSRFYKGEPTINYAQYEMYCYAPYYTYSKNNDIVYFYRQYNSKSKTITLANSTFKSNLTDGDIYTISGYLYVDDIPYQTSVSVLSTYINTTISKKSRSDGYFEYTQSFIDNTWFIHSLMAGDVLTGSTVKIEYLQIEKKSHSTQFVNGTRSVTDSLIDLKRTTTIDLSDISFDWTAHPYFDGTNVIQTTYAPNFSDFTICVWFKDENTPLWGRLVDKLYSAGLYMTSYYNGNKNYVGAGIIEPNSPYGIGLPYSAGDYHYFVSSRNGTTHNIYLDGITQKNSKTGSTSLLDNTSFAFGCWSNSASSQVFKGKLPIVHIYNRALSESEILQNYNAQKERFAFENKMNQNLQLHLDAGNKNSYPIPTTGTTWYDIKGTNNATLTTGTTFDLGYDGSILFNGINNYANFYVPNLTNIATVEMWAKANEVTDCMFFGWNLYDVYSNNSLGYNTANGDLYGLTSTQITNLSILGNWKHYIFEMRSDVSYTNNKIYVNGVSQSLSQVSGTENVSARTFNNGNGRISGWRTNTGYPMNINVAVFKVYNRILTQNEITQLFNKDKKRFNL